MLARIERSLSCSSSRLALLDLHGGRLEPELVGPGGEVLVGDAQLLDGRRELLVERLELLVGRLELLVEGLDLLAAGLRVLARPEQGLVGQPEIRDQRRQLVVRPQQAVVQHRRLVQPLAGPRVRQAIAFQPGHVGQLDDDRRHVTGVVQERAHGRLEMTRRIARDVGGLDLVDGMAGLRP